MSTNYHWHPKAEPACVTCGHASTAEPIHIGKSSAGWVFALRIYPDGVDGEGTARIHDLDDWRHIFRDREGHIENEYGEVVPYADLEKTITERKHLVEGRALRRHTVGTFCTENGHGSWDLFAREFS